MITLEDGRTDAYMTKDGRVWGSYLHGIFDNEDLVFALVQDIMKEKGINLRDFVAEKPLVVRWLIYLCLVFVTAPFGYVGTTTEFMYAQF